MLLLIYAYPTMVIVTQFPRVYTSLTPENNFNLNISHVAYDVVNPLDPGSGGGGEGVI